jgi:colanic acid/amylovoran biosynthesis protein
MPVGHDPTSSGVGPATSGGPVSSYAIIGGTLWGNRGAEAMVVTTIGRLRDREPDARFLVLSYQAATDRALVRDPAVRIADAAPGRLLLLHLPVALLCWLMARVGLRLPDALLPADVRALRRCRALLDVTGISFHDGRLGVVAYNVVCLWPALLLGVPVIRLSQAMGPFRNPINRFAARRVVSASTYSFVRGRLTAELVAALRVPADRVGLAADVAFAYRPSDRLTAEHLPEVAALAERLDAQLAARTHLTPGAPVRGIVAVIPSSLVLKGALAAGQDYVGGLRRLLRHLHERGHHVLLLPNATSQGRDTLRNNDLEVIRRLELAIAGDPQLSDPAFLTAVRVDIDTASIRALLSRCEATITSRFHGMVASLALGVPTLVLGWSHKYEEVLEMFGCADDAVQAADALADPIRVERSLVPVVDAFLDGLPERRERIARHLPGVTASAEAQFEVVASLPD